MKSMTRYIIVPLLFFVLILTACSYKDDPAKVVEHYLNAKVSQDEDTLRDLLCSELAERYEKELYSFASASDATIEGMQCRLSETANLVICEGMIIAKFDDEVNQFPLSLYRVVEEEGGWKWCGEAP